jgi:hypothetical protein
MILNGKISQIWPLWSGVPIMEEERYDLKDEERNVRSLFGNQLGG